MVDFAPSRPRGQQFDVNPRIGRLVPYRPGKPIEEVERELGISNIIKLASNENSLGPSPLALEAAQRHLTRMHLYPDALSFDLRNRLSDFLEVPANAIVFGNGSDDIIHLLGITFLEPGDEVIQGDPSFVRYEAAAILNECPCHLVPLTRDWVHDLDAMAAAVNERTRLVFIANPNNPTGTVVAAEGLRSFVAAMPERVVVVIDEAYYEYALESEGFETALDLVSEGANVVVLRTFSKAYGLAGFRIGYGVARPEIAAWIERTREPFNINGLAQAAAGAALGDVGHLRRTLEMNRTGHARLAGLFSDMGFGTSRSAANFMWVDTGRDSKAVFQALLLQGVIIRTGDIFGAPTHIRVTVGTAAENDRFAAALARAASEIKPVDGVTR